MSRGKLGKQKKSSQGKRQPQTNGDRTNKDQFRGLLNWFVPQGSLFDQKQFHGNVKWNAEQVTRQALIWAWQESRNVTDAFGQTREVCNDLGMDKTISTYTGFMNSLVRYSDTFRNCLHARLQDLAEAIGGEHFRTDGWVLIGFDGSRATAPRSVSNERAFCAPNYGKGKRAKYGKKKSKGMRRKRNKANPPAAQVPQVWITMMWHMSLRLPWTWKLGPSNASERTHVKQMLDGDFPENTLFCGDAGFTGYPLWSSITATPGQHFLVRVGANVRLLSETADVKKLGGGKVLCWPKGRMDSGDPPLHLRLVKVTVGKTKMWMLTSVLNERKLTRKQIARFYELRWGIEVAFRGLKQTIDKHTMRCRNNERLLAELDWSILAMGVAELFALHEQIGNDDADVEAPDQVAYDPQHRSLANTMRALRKCMRRLHRHTDRSDLLHSLAHARVQRYENTTDKRARYRPRNPDKKPLGDPTVRKITPKQSRLLKKQRKNAAA